MEPIKITDKLTLRQEALRMAVEISKSHERAVAETLPNADVFESYIKGKADLPEYVDPNADKQQWVDMLNKMREEMKPNPWISVDSEMKPPKGVEVLCALHYAINNIEYVVMSYNPEEKVWYGGNDDDNTNHVVAWCPIVPFSQPTL